MSAKPIATVDITVRTGAGTNLARAGSGKHAATSSSTHSPYQAALSAAQKYFGCPARYVVVSYLRDQAGIWQLQGDRHAKAIKVLHLEFEDRGQDFYKWEVVLSTGQIINCLPFQFTTWARCIVLNPEGIATGSYVTVTAPHGDTLTINYRVVKMRISGGAS